MCVEVINGMADTIAKLEEELAELKRHGKWIGAPLAGYATVRCSECGDVFFENTGRWHYCPNCGAKMEEVEE